MDESILNLPDEDKIKVVYFAQRTINHPFFVQARNELLYRIKQNFGQTLTFVIGPSGAGKTYLIDEISATVLKEESQLMLEHPDYIPIISWKVEAASTKTFSWKSTFFEGFRHLNQSEDMSKKKIGFKVGNMGNTSDLRRAFENSIEHRRLKWLILDDAQHFNKALSGTSAQDNMDVLKSLADKAKCRIILVGTYELISMLFHSAQLSRRSRIIHFPRYNMIKSDTELAYFKKAVRTFEGLIPVIKKPDLCTYWEFLYERTIGCVGILKDWLLDALILTLKENSPKLDMLYLERTAIGLKECEEMLEEAEEGEQLLTESSSERNEFRKKLGLLHDEEPTKKNSTMEQVSKTRPKTHFKRNSSRDKIGIKKNKA